MGAETVLANLPVWKKDSRLLCLRSHGQARSTRWAWKSFITNIFGQTRSRQRTSNCSLTFSRTLQLARTELIKREHLRIWSRSMFTTHRWTKEKLRTRLITVFRSAGQHGQCDIQLILLKDGSLFNALGGCLSLWLGVSFCNLFEILELVLDLIGNIINRIAKKALGRKTNPL